MLEATAYTRIYGQQQLEMCWCVVAGVSSSERRIMVDLMKDSENLTCMDFLSCQFRKVAVFNNKITT